MGGGRRARKATAQASDPRAAVQTADGWRDEAPDLTTGEHDVMSALLEMAWHDVKIKLESVPSSRYEEALAAKLTAYEWITSEDEYLMSFRSVCLHVGINDVARTRRVMLRDVTIPKATVPQKWLDEFASMDREDRGYVKRSRPALSEPSMPEMPPEPPREPEPEPEPEPCCPELDAETWPAYTLEALVAEVNVPEEPATTGDALADWDALAAASEDPEAAD